MDDGERIQEAVTRALAEALPDNVVTQFAIIFKVIEADGDQAFWDVQSRGLLPWDELGMYDFRRSMICAGIKERPHE